MKKQKYLDAEAGYGKLEAILKEQNARKLLLVCDDSFEKLNIHRFFDNLEKNTGIQVVSFRDFKPNPQYESVMEGVSFFYSQGCDFIAAVGGGSAMDVAKCVKLYSKKEIPFLAVPTTAGTGSEATSFAVIYENGEKQSVSDESCLPDYVLLDASVLLTLPDYQRKATMMDALCHAIEAFWSVNATKESREYSEKAIKIIMEHYEDYLKNREEGNIRMQKAANYAGKAIHLAQTTAAHAMSYKLTSLYGIAHGHAAAICLPIIWRYMIEESEREQSETDQLQVFDKIAFCMNCKSRMDAVQKFESMVKQFELKIPELHDKKELGILTVSVNSERLKNNPFPLNSVVLNKMYRQILNQSNEMDGE